MIKYFSAVFVPYFGTYTKFLICAVFWHNLTRACMCGRYILNNLIRGALCPLWVAYRFEVCNISIFAGCGLLFGLCGWIYAPPPHPKNQNAKSGLPFRKIFSEFFYFFYFLLLSFCVKRAYFRCFS